MAMWLCCNGVIGDDWPQWLGPERDAVWRETGVLDRFPEGGLKVRWKTPIGAGYSGPTISGGMVFVTDRVLDPEAMNPSNPFDRATIPGVERVHALNEADGRVLWTHEYACRYTVSYPAGPRASPLVAEGKVFTLGAEGHLRCLETATGKVVWAKDLNQEYGTKTPVWGYAGHPLLDGRKLICLVGGEGSVVVAFDKDTGAELWRALSAKEPGYAPPMIYEFGGKRQLIVWHPESVSGLDPETGVVFWTHPVEARSGLSIPTPRKDGERLFITSFYNGSLMLDLAGGHPEVLWRSPKVSEKDTAALHSIMPTPFILDGYIYGVCSYGQFRCLDARTGERIWESFAPTTGRSTRWGNAFIVRHEDRFFLFNELGDLILARLSPKGYEEVSRRKLIEPTNTAAGRDVVWSHPAFANRSVYVRNDKELVCVSLAKERGAH
jgi:outer membrane protein assembly factor BamB